MGPTDRYLRVASGYPTHDLLAMARHDMRTRLRSAIQQASQENLRIIVAGGRINHNGYTVSFNIDVQPVQSEGEELLLICFVDEPKHEPKRGGAVKPGDVPRIASLEQELDATKTELQGAIRSLEVSI